MQVDHAVGTDRNAMDVSAWKATFMLAPHVTSFIPTKDDPSDLDDSAALRAPGQDALQLRYSGTSRAATLAISPGGVSGADVLESNRVPQGRISRFVFCIRTASVAGRAFRRAVPIRKQAPLGAAKLAYPNPQFLKHSRGTFKTCRPFGTTVRDHKANVISNVAQTSPNPPRSNHFHASIDYL